MNAALRTEYAAIALRDLDFKHPVEIGETVTARCRVVEHIDDDSYCLTVRAKKPDGENAIYGAASVLIHELPDVT